jgi:MFS family permease
MSVWAPVSAVRHHSALQTGAAFLPWTLTVAVLAQGITARLVDRFGPLPVITSGMGSAVAGLLLFATVGPDTTFFPTIFLACFAIGLGIGTAFMPLLTLAMADVPAEDAGLGSGITNLSQQIGGALGLAVLSTIAANHTKALADDHELTTRSSAAISSRSWPEHWPSAAGPAGDDGSRLPSNFDIEENAA